MTDDTPRLAGRITRGLIAASWLLLAPSALAGWSNYESLFEVFPCPDGWSGCEVDGEHVTSEPIRSSNGTPMPSSSRVDFLTLKPTGTFDPFTKISDYSRISAPTAAPEPPPPPPPPPPPQPPVDDGGDGVVDVDPVPQPDPVRPDPSPVRPDPSPVRPTPSEPEPMVRPKPEEPAPVKPEPMVRPKPVEPEPEPEPKAPDLPVQPKTEPEPMVRPKPEPPAPSGGSGDGVTKALVVEGCDDLRALEPLAMMGRLDGGAKGCLEDRIAGAKLQTDKRASSLVLIQNAWTADKKEWAKLVKRHLEEIDKSDPTLCYKYAQYLQRAGSHYSVIKWADVALENKTYWTGETHTARVYSLYKLKAASANAIWLKAEEAYNAAPSGELDEKRGSARSKAKTYAREWLDYAKTAGKDTTKALQYCESAAGNSDYCAG